MQKRLLVSVVVVLFILAIGGLAQGIVFEEKDKEKILVYEHLNWTQTGYGEVILDTRLETPNPYSFESGPFMTFNVPPSPKATALFFELWGQSIHYWVTGYSPQTFYALVTMKLVSNLIPNGINVYMLHGLTGIRGIYHDNFQSDRNKRNWKVILRRDSMLRQYTDWWDIRYDNGSRVPKEQAQVILNDLIDNGFDVEISLSGDMEGVRRFFFYSFQAEVTRLVKK